MATSSGLVVRSAVDHSERSISVCWRFCCFCCSCFSDLCLVLEFYICNYAGTNIQTNEEVAIKLVSIFSRFQFLMENYEIELFYILFLDFFRIFRHFKT